MALYVNEEDERAAKLLDSYREHEPLSSEEIKLLRILRQHGKLLAPYVTHNFRKLVNHMSDPLNVSKMLAYRIAPAKSNSKHPMVINISEMAAKEGYSVNHIATLLRDKGYKVKYDRNRIYCLDRVITYVEVK